MLEHVVGITYLAPLREGGSLPGIVECDDDGTYVVKFRGAGQGSASLVSEIVVGELGRRLGVRVPELVIVAIDPEMARRDPDEEIQDLLRASPGDNLGMDYLPGSVGYDGVRWRAAASEAARIYWLDALTANIDRTWRNPNLIVWHKKLWAIDHGAALPFQHAWPEVPTWAARTYDLSQHVLSEVVSTLDGPALRQVASELSEAVTPTLLAEVLALVPDSFLTGMNSAPAGVSAQRLRGRYVDYLTARLAHAQSWWPKEVA